METSQEDGSAQVSKKPERDGYSPGISISNPFPDKVDNGESEGVGVV